MPEYQDMPTPSEEQQRFTERYLTGVTPWDSGISPPELLEVVTGPAALAPDNMLDIGCGTGTNCLTLAKLGWQTTGLDFAAPAIEMAQQKAIAAQDEIARAGGSTHFIQADVTRWRLTPDATRFSLLLDLGCLNGIPHDERTGYASMVAGAAMPDALFLLYVHLPDPENERIFGCTHEEVMALFSRAFTLERYELGVAPQGGKSMWCWLRRI
jgi:SAM-dependent methyltransferase